MRTTDIVWISGPHFPGTGGSNDLSIFRKALIHMLDPGERVEADDGYAAECPGKTKTPNGITRLTGERAELNTI